ncbi:hypothetical protein HDU67_006038 [Dinochytrium kinnereticum]|nr:hypothetical protein HDU67_006038 [Dinochytrium kinnereticum]
MDEDEKARFQTFELERSKFDFLSPLMAGLKKMADANITVGDAELAEMRRTIEQVKLKVAEAEQYIKKVPGIELTEEQQLKEIERLKKIQLLRR